MAPLQHNDSSGLGDHDCDDSSAYPDSDGSHLDHSSDSEIIVFKRNVPITPITPITPNIEHKRSAANLGKSCLGDHAASTPNAEPDGSAHLDNSSLSGLVPAKSSVEPDGSARLGDSSPTDLDSSKPSLVKLDAESRANTSSMFSVTPACSSTPRTAFTRGFLKRSDESTLTSGESQEKISQASEPVGTRLFVADLPVAHEDAAIAQDLRRAFGQYGKAIVKMRRDAKGMPIAFVEFPTEDQARAALLNGRGTAILGRPCRIEISTSARGPTIPLTAGSTKPHASTPQKVEMAKENRVPDIPATGFPKLKAYTPKKELRASTSNKSLQPYTPTKENDDDLYRRQIEADNRTIFVNGLPFETTQEDLKAFLSTISPIIKVKIVRQVNESGPRAYAFVQYSNDVAPERAIERLDKSEFHGVTLRIMRKITRSRDGLFTESQRWASSQPLRSPQSPRGTSSSAGPQLAGGSQTPGHSGEPEIVGGSRRHGLERLISWRNGV